MCEHVPVMVKEAVEWLACSPGETFVDCTVGLGGHSAAILERIQPSGNLVAIDSDADSLKEARERLSRWKENVTFVRDNFRNLAEILKQVGVEQVKGILFDLGMSSAQVGTPSRGFSFCQDGPLDMRFDRRQSLTAAEIVNRYPEKEIVNIIREFGEERSARRIAAAIVRGREKSGFDSTTELAGIVAEVLGPRRSAIHPATRTFQALRIAVNQEMGALQVALPQAIMALKPGGRLVVLSYHSLEDRIVKETFREFQKGCICPPTFPVCRCGRSPEVEILTRKPITPSPGQVRDNPRSRSARMRVCERKRRNT